MKLMRSLLLVAVTELAVTAPVLAGPSLGLSTDIVAETSAPGSVPLVQQKQAATLYLDKGDFPGVLRAAGDLQADVERVSGVKPEIKLEAVPTSKTAVIIGTLGSSPLVDGLVKAGTIKTDTISGKWESFIITTVSQPMPGVDEALVIAGSDRRGTIYGIYEISEQIGVSPWYWWADVPAKHHEALFIKAGTYVQGPPAVKYRGIFINDEDPCLGGWSRAKFGGVNSKMYTHMFELILRCRGNYLWPAMWGKAFNEDDPLNPKLADVYGIVMGTSHHEPLMRAQKEWTTHRAQYGNTWDFSKNPDGLTNFWTEGVARNKNYENIYTVGMRGDGDMAMPDAGGPEANKKLLEKIIGVQQDILAKNVNPDLNRVPQLWALFTEVQKYYDAGLKLPENVTLLFTDDNVGNVRRVPLPSERNRLGGSGIYFHMDMNGGPFSYKWLNSNPLPKVWEQMNLVHEYGANQIWLVNVGDLKPLEIPLEFFLRMGWQPAAICKDNIAAYQLKWAQREFGPDHAAEIADIVAKYAKYNAMPKPEMLRANTYSLVNYQEAERISQQWNELAAKAQKLNESIPADQKDAYYELVLHPAIACANFYDLYIAAGRNALYVQQHRASANAEAAKVRELFQKDADYSAYYNTKLADGKWSHMMDQTHIGYKGWQSPQRNIMPEVREVTLSDSGELGVAIDGSTEAWPGGESEAVLPTLDSLSRQRTYLDVFARGSKPIEFKAMADKPWITLKEEKAPNSGQDRRLWVDVNWSQAPEGESKGLVTISGSSDSATVKLNLIKATNEQEQQAKGCFASLSGPIAFSPADATANVPVANVRWEKIPDFGRVAAAMEIFPVTAESIKPGQAAPRLEYAVYFSHPGTYNVEVVTSPTLNIIPARGLSLAVSLDDSPPQIINAFSGQSAKDDDFLGKNHPANTANNARTMHFTQDVTAAGKHTLKISMVDPTVCLQKIIVHDKPLPNSYFGPAEMVVFGK